MLTPTEITAALKRAVEALFPGEKVYENLEPRNAKRPCNLVELQSIALGSISPGGVELRYTYRITDFVEVDERHQSHMPLLDLRTTLLVGLFAKGYLRVKDRALKVGACATSHNFDFTETKVELVITHNRSDFEPEVIHPIMEQLTLNTKLKEDKPL